MVIEKTNLVSAQEIAALRLAVGWDALEKEHEAAQPNLFAQYSIHQDKQLIAYAAAISDKVIYALLVDVLVLPEFQLHSLGKKLVCFAVQDLHSTGIRNVGALFNPKLESFYNACGLETVSGGYSRIN